MTKVRKIMIVAGEASGDRHAARLTQSLLDLEPETKFEIFGAAGPEMRRAGVDAVVVSDELSIVGLLEIGRAVPTFLRAINTLKKEATTRRPDAAVLVDFPDFNLRLAKSLKKRGIKVVYYISPQLWAWRHYRIATVRKYVDLMLTILPFEAEWYRTRGVQQIEFVGHPLANEVYPTVSKEVFCQQKGLDPDKPVISLLPGSRHKEILRILPVMLAAAGVVEKRFPDVQIIVALAADKHVEDFEKIWLESKSRGVNLPTNLTVVVHETYNAANASDAAAVTSGTATLEAGIIGTPMAVVYKTSAINFALFEPMISVDHYGLINLIAGSRVARELIQNEFTSDSLADELIRLMNPETNRVVREKLASAVEKIGEGGASMRAAKAILREIGDASESN